MNGRVAFYAALGVATILLLPAVVLAQGDDEGHCIWYGLCGYNPDLPIRRPDLYCAYDGPAIELPEDQYEFLNSTCPTYYDMLETDGKIELCCNGDMVGPMPLRISPGRLLM